MTYSIVARDTKTGQLGVAVQTHWFGVGNNVPWLEAGVGAIATQAQTNMDYGKKGLKFLEAGKTADEVIKEIGTIDEAFESRQVAMIDNQGNISAHTGKNCVDVAGYIIGDNFVVQGNILTNEEVLPAMKKAYEENLEKDFPQRLYLCIKAAQDTGGELRGTQSAALRIVSGEKDSYDIMNLRIDDHENPLEELGRQIKIQEAYNFLNEAEEQGETGDIEMSLELFSKALEIIPGSEEFLFWKAFMLQNRGRLDEAEKIFSKFGKDTTWGELRKRIS